MELLALVWIGVVAALMLSSEGGKQRMLLVMWGLLAVPMLYAVVRLLLSALLASPGR